MTGYCSGLRKAGFWSQANCRFSGPAGIADIIHVFGLTLFTIIIKYLFLKDLYFYFDDFSVFSYFEKTHSIIPLFTDRPIAGLFLLCLFQLFKWNAIFYHIFGMLLEIIGNFTVYRVCDRMIWHNKFYSSLTVLFFLLMPGHSQQYWWITILCLKLLLIVWLGSLYSFYQFILTNKNKYLLVSSSLYGITLFWYELAIFLPIIHSLFYVKLVIWKKKLIDFKKLVTISSYFVLYICAFILFRFTKSFGLSSQFDRSRVAIENIFFRVKAVLFSSFWFYPQLENSIGSQAFKGSNLTELSFIIAILLFLFLLITWFYSFFESLNTPDIFRKSDYIFTSILSGCLYIYPLTPFFLTSSTWFDSRHNYLPHFGLSIFIVLLIRAFLENIRKFDQKIVKYAFIPIFLFCLTQIFVNNAKSMIGLGTSWRQVGLDLRNYEAIVKRHFPTVHAQTLFLIKDAEVYRQHAPVFAGSWVVDGFFNKVYPLQGVKGAYYNHKDKEQLMFEVNPDLNSISVDGQKYSFDQIIILDGKNQLRPFSALYIKNHEGEYFKRLQASDNAENSFLLLELSIPNS